MQPRVELALQFLAHRGKIKIIADKLGHCLDALPEHLLFSVINVINSIVVALLGAIGGAFHQSNHGVRRAAIEIRNSLEAIEGCGLTDRQRNSGKTCDIGMVRHAHRPGEIKQRRHGQSHRADVLVQLHPGEFRQPRVIGIVALPGTGIQAEVVVIAPAISEIDASDIGNFVIDHDRLLVMGEGGAESLHVALLNSGHAESTGGILQSSIELEDS